MAFYSKLLFIIAKDLEKMNYYLVHTHHTVHHHTLGY